MELAIKLYHDKPSRIGVRFIYEYQAVKEYEQVFSMHPDRVYNMKIEFVRQKIELTLTGEETGAKIQYRHLEFRREQVEKLQAFYYKGMALEFVHIYPKANALFVAKPFRKAQFLSISEVTILNPFVGHH